jgi:hypothetical protein
MEHITTWSMLLILIYWQKTYHKERTVLDASKEIAVEVNAEEGKNKVVIVLNQVLHI